MFKRLTIAIACLGLTTLLGCDPQNGSSSQATPTPEPTIGALQGIMDSIGAHVNGATSKVGSLYPDELQGKTVDEVQKLFRWEYRVIELLETASSSAELERTLSSAGQEGWECFSVIPKGTSIQILCKRRPKSVLSYLKYVPFL